MVAAISVFQLLAFIPVMLRWENLGEIQQDGWLHCFWTSKTHQRIGPKPAGRTGGMSAPLLPFLNDSRKSSFSPGVISSFGLRLLLAKPVGRAHGLAQISQDKASPRTWKEVG